MADVKSRSYGNPIHMAPYGNVGGPTRMAHRTSAMTNGDKIVFGTIPNGSTILDWIMLNTASSASTTMTLGFRNSDGTAVSPIDGDATAKIPADDFFIAATSIAAAAVTRRGAPGTIANQKGMTLGPIKQDIIIVGALAGASIATDTLIELVFFYICEGVK